MSVLEIIGVAPSTYTRAIRMVCEEKNVPYQLTNAPPHSPAVTAIHPLGKIPVMRHGDVEIAESRAIAAYIDRVFPGPKLIPDDTMAAARMEQWVSMVNTVMDRSMVRNYVLQYVFAKDGKPDRGIISQAVDDMKMQLPILDKAVAKTGYLAGEGFTFADINALVILAYLQQFPESAGLLHESRHLPDYLARHSARPSFQATIPSRPD